MGDWDLTELDVSKTVPSGKLPGWGREMIAKLGIIGVSVGLTMIVVVAGGILGNMIIENSSDTDRAVINELDENGGTIVLNESIGSSSYLTMVNVLKESSVHLDGSYIVVENTGYSSTISKDATVMIPMNSVLYIRLNTE